MIYRIERYAQLSSTNDHLRERAKAGAPEGTVIIAEEQTAGRGRLGRSWVSPKGGAWFSILLKPPIPAEQAGCISVLIAVSLAKALREHWKIPVGVKWPNDLYVRDKKLGGILIELSSRSEKIDWLIAGIGINVNNEPPQQTRVPATSLARELGRALDLAKFFEVVLDALARDYRRFLAEGPAFIQREWARLSVLPPRITVESGTEQFDADVLGLSASGKLIVRVGESIRELTSEEVTICQLQPS